MKTLSIKPLNSFQIIVLGFAGVILAGCTSFNAAGFLLPPTALLRF